MTDKHTGGPAFPVPTGCGAEKMTHPRCFNSRKEYDSWRESARKCGESCSICDDCTPAYMHEMQLQGRCDRTIFWGFVPKKKT